MKSDGVSTALEGSRGVFKPSTAKILLLIGLTVVLVWISYRRLEEVNDMLKLVGTDPVNYLIRSRSAQAFDLSQCNVPPEMIRSGGPPKDGIPALVHPQKIPASEADFLRPEDRVIGVVVGNTAVAYPIGILNWHECVNDTVEGKPIAVTYCPLCDSAFVFDRNIGGETRTFGISGLLLNSNVLLYDRHENPSQESLWSQIAMKAVCGPAAEKGEILTLFPSELVTWRDWAQGHPHTEVLSPKTGYQRDYSRSPYESYFRVDDLMFPVQDLFETPAELAGAYPNKERLLVVRKGFQTRIYPYSELNKAAEKEKQISDRIGDVRFKIAYNPSSNTAKVLDASPDSSELTTAYSFWFAWKAFQKDYDVFANQSGTTNSR